MRLPQLLKYLTLPPLFAFNSLPLSLFMLTCTAGATTPYTGIDLYVIGTTRFANPPTEGQGAVAAGGQVIGDGSGNPLLFSGPSGTVTNLQPNGYSFAFPQGTDGIRQVGIAVTNSSLQHAMMWSGTAGSAIDLQPTNLPALNHSQSGAIGIYGSQQVGYGRPSGGSGGALLWNDSANSAVDLSPTNLGAINFSTALATDGTHQVGFANFALLGGGEESRAVLWSGTASSAVDLNPTNLSQFYSTQANGVAGSQQVGYGIRHPNSQTEFHALLWTGSASSAVDLNPTNLSGFEGAMALGTNGSQQVGLGVKGSNTFDGPFYSALLWNGTANSAVDLNALLPFTATSIAFSIDAQGDIFGTAVDSLGNIHAVEWQPVPEPSTVVLVSIGIVSLLGYRRRLAA